MYVRDAKNREEVWLLDRIEELGLADPAFRSRDYVVALDEESNEKAGFGRVRLHKTDDETYCELALFATLPEWRGQGVGAHVLERLVAKASDAEFETVYAFTADPNYLLQFGFEPREAEDLPPALRDRLAVARETRGEDAVAMRLLVDRFRMPERLRDRFKSATPGDDPAPGEPGAPVEETAEDFGIDPDETTYKYDTGK
jgi:N-acetylglutamate synthase-like GNAT family acetyltransferase